MSAGIIGYFLVPAFGWKALFIVGLIPAVLMIPLRVLMPESPRWLAARGKIDKADKVVSMLEKEAIKQGKPLPEPVVRPVGPKATAKSDWRELFKGIDLKRTLMIWVLWIAVYTVTKGMIFPPLIDPLMCMTAPRAGNCVHQAALAGDQQDERLIMTEGFRSPPSSVP